MSLQPKMQHTLATWSMNSLFEAQWQKHSLPLTIGFLLHAYGIASVYLKSEDQIWIEITLV